MSGRPRFGEVLSRFRIDKDVWAKDVGDRTYNFVVDITDIENGKTTPPGSPCFYARLRYLPDMTSEILVAMIDCDDVPKAVKARREDILHGRLFGDVLHDFRLREELTIVDIAQALLEPPGHIAAIEAHSLPPPGYSFFYKRIPYIKFMTLDKMRPLRMCPDVPEGMFV
jgi:hypothetical protein